MAEETKIESKSEADYSPSPKEKELIEKWQKRFKRAKAFRKPFQEKWLRMYKLYRAYQDKENYAYETRLMPAIAFEIVETVVSRLATAKRKTRILPREKKDAQSKALDSWDDLVNYDFDIIKLKKKLRQWLKAATTYGNGIAMTTWLTDGDYDDPAVNIEDLWDILPAPETIDLQEDCPWLIRRLVKTKGSIERKEKAREKAGLPKLYKNLEFVEPKEVEDWKKERYEINGLKMSQIKGKKKKEEGGEEIKVGEKAEGEKQIEIWEIWDFEEGKLIGICNEKILIRDDENPYQKINNGKIFIDLPDHLLNWELWATGHIEPVETTILEIADLRNQRMDDVILMLDPVVKITKDRGISKEDIIFAPGAKWELKKLDDVVVERPPDISPMGINEDVMMRNEIERTLAMSEYMQGVPKSKQEPSSKVAMLLGQGNLRLITLADQIAEALTQLVNNLIQLNREFIDKNKFYRIVGDEVDFKEFTKEDKEVKVDAIVEIEPIIPPDQETRLNQVLMLYEKFVAEDKPDPNNPDELKQWRKRKRELQKMILEELNKEAYEKVLLGEEPETPSKPKETASPSPEETRPPSQPASPGVMSKIMAKIPILNKIGK
ncbi:hypothetical protein AMJ49_06540 [Parcubacteria bacterium DG_74_2]|nr:MAG: hypothetical protein AMJ49_06540 [Parcubacteria bacterium DG_74_2]